MSKKTPKVPLSPQETRDRRRQVALAALSGLFYVVAFPGQDVWPFLFVAWVPVALAMRDVTVKRALLLGTVVGFTSHLGGYYWIVHLLRQFAQAPIPLAVLGYLACCLGQGASYGVGMAFARYVKTRTGWGWAASIATGLAAMDLVYPLLFQSYIANTTAAAPLLMQTAEIWGVLGLAAIIGAANGAIADVLEARRDKAPMPKRTILAVGAIWAFALVFGAIRMSQVDATGAAAEKLSVGLVQANLGGFENHRERAEGAKRHAEATKNLHAQGVELVIWPEGASHRVIEIGDDLSPIAGGVKQAMLVGGTRLDIDSVTGERAPFNSAFIANHEGIVTGSYDKNVLLAFGEYVPGDAWFPGIYKLLPYTSHFGRGISQAPLVHTDRAGRTWRLGTYICYEDILPRFVQQAMAERDGHRPDVMVNITNDSWYGDTTEPPIHLALAQFRAVEHRRALVRATNTGISAIVDANGRLVAKTHTYREETLVGDVPRMGGSTVYENIGDVAGFGALGVLAFASWQGRKRKPAAA